MKKGGEILHLHPLDEQKIREIAEKTERAGILGKLGVRKNEVTGYAVIDDSYFMGPVLYTFEKRGFRGSRQIRKTTSDEIIVWPYGRVLPKIEARILGFYDLPLRRERPEVSSIPIEEFLRGTYSKRKPKRKDPKRIFTEALSLKTEIEERKVAEKIRERDEAIEEIEDTIAELEERKHEAMIAGREEYAKRIEEKIVALERKKRGMRYIHVKEPTKEVIRFLKEIGINGMEAKEIISGDIINVPVRKEVHVHYVIIPIVHRDGSEEIRVYAPSGSDISNVGSGSELVASIMGNEHVYEKFQKSLVPLEK